MTTRYRFTGCYDHDRDERIPDIVGEGADWEDAWYRAVGTWRDLTFQNWEHVPVESQFVIEESA